VRGRAVQHLRRRRERAADAGDDDAGECDANADVRLRGAVDDVEDGASQVLDRVHIPTYDCVN
jgi:hypothetical protein